MAYKVEIALLANKDLKEILDYILRELSNPSDAADLLDGIGSCYSNLEKMPEMYKRCRDTRLKAMGYRRITVKNYTSGSGLPTFFANLIKNSRHFFDCSGI